jgi:hypothetical protein
VSDQSSFLFTLVRYLAPKAGQIDVRSSKHVIGYDLSSITPALVGPLPTFVSAAQHHGGSSPQTSVLRLSL